MIKVVVQSDDFDSSIETHALSASSKGIGGIVSFTGFVRNINQDDPVSSLFLEHYPGMTEQQIKEIITEAIKRWEVVAATVIHRIGELYPGDQIVFVAVASPHRGDAFAASEYIIDFLKTKATFWKREKVGTASRWLDSRQSDFDAAARWDIK